MIDIAVFYLIALALSMMEPSATESHFDLVVPENGEVVPLVAHRTANGFRITGSGEPFNATTAGRNFKFAVPGTSEVIEIDLSEVAETTLHADSARTFTLAKQEYQIIPSRGIRYVMAKGQSPILVAHMPVAATASVKMTGILRVHEIPQTMSVKAYLAHEFTLERPGLPEVALSPSATVSHADLTAQDGKTVEVEGVMVPAPAPNPEESYPMGPDGKPLERDPSLEVRVLRATPPGK